MSENKRVDSVVIVSISSTLKLLYVSLRGPIRIKALKILPLPQESKEEFLQKSLQAFIQDNRITQKFAILNLPLHCYQIKRFTIPNMPARELLLAIGMQIQDDLDFDVEQAMIDFRIIGTTTKDDGSKIHDIVCIVAQQSCINNLAAAVQKAGFNLLSATALPLGYGQFLNRHVSLSPKEPVAIVHINTDSCFFAIYREGTLRFFRELPIALNNIKSSLGASLSIEKGSFQLNAEEIEEVLFTIGIASPQIMYKDKISYAHILSLMRPHLERLIAEIKRSFAYYESHYRDGAVYSVLLAGSGSEIMALDKFLSEELHIKTERLALSSAFSVAETVDKRKASEVVSEAVAAVDYQKTMNLLPVEYRLHSFELAEKISLRLIAYVALSLLVIFCIFTGANASWYKRRLGNATLHLGVLQQVQRLTSRADYLAKLKAAIQNKRTQVSALLKVLSASVPQEIFFEEFIFNHQEMSGTLSGYVRTSNENPEIILTNFMRQMEDSGSAASVSLSSIDKAMREGASVSRFSIIFKVQ